MSCIIPNNILDIDLIYIFFILILKVCNNKLLPLITFWIITILEGFYHYIKSE
jgi:hypothetical protein